MYVVGRRVKVLYLLYTWEKEDDWTAWRLMGKDWVCRWEEDEGLELGPASAISLAEAPASSVTRELGPAV